MPTDHEYRPLPLPVLTCRPGATTASTPRGRPSGRRQGHGHDHPTGHAGHSLAGIDDYMRDLIQSARGVVPGSARVIASMGDERPGADVPVPGPR